MSTSRVQATVVPNVRRFCPAASSLVGTLIEHRRMGDVCKVLAEDDSAITLQAIRRTQRPRHIRRCTYLTLMRDWKPFDASMSSPNTEGERTACPKGTNDNT